MDSRICCCIFSSACLRSASSLMRASSFCKENIRERVNVRDMCACDDAHLLAFNLPLFCDALLQLLLVHGICSFTVLHKIE